MRFAIYKENSGRRFKIIYFIQSGKKEEPEKLYSRDLQVRKKYTRLTKNKVSTIVRVENPLPQIIGALCGYLPRLRNYTAKAWLRWNLQCVCRSYF